MERGCSKCVQGIQIILSGNNYFRHLHGIVGGGDVKRRLAIFTPYAEICACRDKFLGSAICVPDCRHMQRGHVVSVLHVDIRARFNKNSDDL